MPAELQVEGMMEKGVAAAAAGSGLVSILDPDRNEHHAAVAVRDAISVELEFTATINPENGMVHQIELESAVSAW